MNEEQFAALLFSTIGKAKNDGMSAPDVLATIQSVLLCIFKDQIKPDFSGDWREIYYKWVSEILNHFPLAVVDPIQKNTDDV